MAIILNNRTKWILLTFIGVITLTSDTLLVWIINTDPFTMIYLKSGIMAFSLAICILFFWRKKFSTLIELFSWEEIFLGFMFLGPNYIHAPKVSLIALLKTVIGPSNSEQGVPDSVRNPMFRPLNSSQQRMWILDSINPQRNDLNITCVIKLNKKIHTFELQRLLNHVINLNLLLGARIVQNGHQLYWEKVIENSEILRQVVLPSMLGIDYHDVVKLYKKFINRPSKLTRRIPWNIQLVHCGKNTYLFCLFHHVICDSDMCIPQTWITHSTELGSLIPLS